MVFRRGSILLKWQEGFVVELLGNVPWRFFSYSFERSTSLNGQVADRIFGYLVQLKPVFLHFLWRFWRLVLFHQADPIRFYLIWPLYQYSFYPYVPLQQVFLTLIWKATYKNCLMAVQRFLYSPTILNCWQGDQQNVRHVCPVWNLELLVPNLISANARVFNAHSIWKVHV